MVLRTSFSLQLKTVRTNRNISLQSKIRILEVTVKTMIIYGFEIWALRKLGEDTLDIFYWNHQRIFLGTHFWDGGVACVAVLALGGLVLR